VDPVLKLDWRQEKKQMSERTTDTHLEAMWCLLTSQLIEIRLTPVEPPKMTFQEFLAWADEDTLAEWIALPGGETGVAEFYQLQEGHYYPAFSGREGRYEAIELPGFWLRVEWLWQEPLPSPIRALAEIVGMDAAVVEAFEKALKGGGNLQSY
jgi:hypothetical protein